MMKNAYKNDIDHLHAPEELIQKTLQNIEEEKQKEGYQEKIPLHEKPQVRKYRRGWGLVLAAAAAVVLALFLPVRDVYEWTLIPGTDMIRDLNEQEEGSREITVEEYSAWLGVDCTTLIQDASYTGGSAVVVKEKDTVTDDAGIFYYEFEGTDVMVVLSRTHDVMPDSMDDLSASRVDGQEVILARSGSTGSASYYAAGEKDGVSYYLYSASAEENTFREIIKNFLES
jgi:hypothetical protein